VTDAELRNRIERAVSVRNDRAVVDPYVRALAELYTRTACYFAALDAWRDCDGPPRDVDAAERVLRDGLPGLSLARLGWGLRRLGEDHLPPPDFEARVMATVSAKQSWWRRALRWLSW
jgi:hypothetical protein